MPTMCTSVSRLTGWTLDIELARGGGGGRQCAGPLSQTLDSLLLRAVGWADMPEDVWRTWETVRQSFCFALYTLFFFHYTCFIIFNTVLRSFMPMGLGCKCDKVLTSVYWCTDVIEYLTMFTSFLGHPVHPILKACKTSMPIKYETQQ